jgi:hypothetical protein
MSSAVDVATPKIFSFSLNHDHETRHQFPRHCGFYIRSGRHRWVDRAVLNRGLAFSAHGQGGGAGESSTAMDALFKL